MAPPSCDGIRKHGTSRPTELSSRSGSVQPREGRGPDRGDALLASLNSVRWQGSELPARDGYMAARHILAELASVRAPLVEH